MSAANTQYHHRLAPERFYWATLDASMLDMRSLFGRSRKHRQLGYLFEAVLPGESIELVHAVYQPIPGRKNHFLACGLSCKDLREESLEQVSRLTPREIPEFLDVKVDPDQLNLLTGPFEPLIIRRMRQRLTIVICTILILSAMMLGAGLHRRAAMLDQATSILISQQSKLVDRALGTSAGSASSPLPSELRLRAERRRLEQTRSSATDDFAPQDRAIVLGELLSVWPTSIDLRTRFLSLGSDRITIQTTVKTMSDAQHLADGLGTLEGWRLDQPQITADNDAVQVTLNLHKTESEEPQNADIPEGR